MGRSRRSAKDDMTKNSTDEDVSDSQHVNRVEDASRAFNNTGMLSLIPDFKGEGENISYYFQQVRDIAKLANWTECQVSTILKTKLKGKALLLLNSNQTLQKAKTLEDIQNILAERFELKSTITQRQLNFQNIKHTPDISIDDLAMQIENSARDLMDIKDSEDTPEHVQKIMMSKFLQIIRRDIRVELLKDSVTNFQEAITRAKEISSILDEVNREEDIQINNINQNSQSIIKNLEDKISRLEQRLHDSQDKCQACLKRGHDIQHCYKFLAFQRQRDGQPSNTGQGYNVRGTTRSYRGTSRNFNTRNRGYNVRQGRQPPYFRPNSNTNGFSNRNSDHQGQMSNRHTGNLNLRRGSGIRD